MKRYFFFFFLLSLNFATLTYFAALTSDFGKPSETDPIGGIWLLSAFIGLVLGGISSILLESYLQNLEGKKI